jgi:hypothetical protein
MISSTPVPIKLGQSSHFNWDRTNRLRTDKDTVTVEEGASQRPGNYQLSGYDPSYQNNKDYVSRLQQEVHFQKVYRIQSQAVDNESYLQDAELTNPRVINQLYARPYAGMYSGPGMRSLEDKDLESALQQGLLTNLRQKACEPWQGKPFHRFQCLPEFGNPQRTEHIIPPPIHDGGWVRGGDATRDYVRRVDYQRRCGNKMNDTVIYQ